MSNEPDVFQQFVDAANAAGLDFILIGGHAVNARGYARTTLDLDFLIVATTCRRGEHCSHNLATRRFMKWKPSLNSNPQPKMAFASTLCWWSPPRSRN